MSDDIEWAFGTSTVLYFSDCRLEIGAREITVGDHRVHMEPKAFDLLLYLIAHRQRVVSKNELLDALWGDHDVSESALSHTIRKVRQAIGDDRSVARAIKTAHRVGYRFVAAVREEEQAGLLQVPPHLYGPAPARPAGRLEQARAAYQLAVRAAHAGRADLALVHCLECGLFEPGCIEAEIGGAQSQDGVPALGSADGSLEGPLKGPLDGRTDVGPDGRPISALERPLGVSLVLRWRSSGTSSPQSVDAGQNLDPPIEASGADGVALRGESKGRDPPG